jgi:hypothetical protein
MNNRHRDKGVYKKVGVVEGRHAIPAQQYLITDRDSRNPKHAHHAAYYAALHFDLGDAIGVELYLGSRYTANIGAALGFAHAGIPVVMMCWQGDKWESVPMKATGKYDE